MEPAARAERRRLMRAPTGLAVVLTLAVFAVRPAAAQTPGHFYNVDKEIQIEAVVRQVLLEPRYQGTAPFLILKVEGTDGHQAYDVEIAPSWFFGEDVHAGEKIRIVGSLTGAAGATPTIIARELRLRGQTFQLRDKRGFPSWQGGPRRQRGIRRFGGP
jgi:hypothetical protein